MTQNISLRFRMYGQSADPVSFMDQMRAALPSFNVHYILGTNAGDQSIDKAKAYGADVITADMNKFDEPVNLMRQFAATLGMPSIFMSPGVGLQDQHVLEALKALGRYHALVYSWQIATQLNNGEGPGKFGYNTGKVETLEALLNAPILPDYVNNGVLPDLKIVKDDGTIAKDAKDKSQTGGGEETEENIQWKRRLKNARFIHNASTVLSMGAKTSTGGVGYDWKIFRKEYVAKVYLALNGMTAEEYTSSIIVL
ncbi:MAG TPA: hypothetical protein VLI92_04760 [Candidatus Saccharimonadales bacterium]|nr:hypothetical protein [Candidatus Saccharimonadales bacterium]